jgi:hypothetical protein
MNKQNRLFILFFFTVVISALLISCQEDEGNNTGTVSGILLDISNKQPIPDTWVVLRTGSGVSTFNETVLENEFIDSIKTDKFGRFKFNNVTLSHSVYNLTPHKEGYLVAEPFLDPPFALQLNAKHIFDTLQMGVKAGIKVSVIHEDVNDGKTASIGILFRTTALGIYRKESIGVTSSEIQREYLYDLNNTIEITLFVYDGESHVTNSKNVIVLTSMDIKNLEFRY